MNLQTVETFLHDFTAWAKTQPDIQAVALVGSYARGVAKPTSDVDLVILAHKPGRLLYDRDWIALFGEVDRQQTEDYGKVTSIRAWYADGREVEYGITDETWAAAPLDDGTRRVIADGMRVLFERGPLLSPHLAEIRK